MRRNLHAGKRHSGGLNLKVFTDDELDEIHLATLEVLKETGLLFDDDEALEQAHAIPEAHQVPPCPKMLRGN